MDYLILVNNLEPLPAGYSDGLTLREVRGKLFESVTATHLEKLLTAAENEGIYLSVISGYRSEDYQQMLWEKEISAEMGRGLSYKEAAAKVGKTLALPGCSEHSTGLAADFGVRGSDDIDPRFNRTAEGRWLCRNCAEFGFILRYPPMKEHITGIDHEPWHFRYVGHEAAELMTRSGICLEEFLHFYSDKYTSC
ncbi:M15 family metallopeptidase [Ruminococcus sp.]|uniref:M15 family metallopeptidase n=1 Tax=Ruminococcus sp. TaxID=41978 RepID=UPI0025E17C97|nr:M15 family metallopeptidase [Ruminococcus sp.]MBQ8965284.1 M15 family metallopeptidase [Ruminococcus sp.]